MSAGRPRALDLDTAMPVIVRLFWDGGYTGPTLDQVAGELGVTKPTLCRTLGDKDAIFSAALRSYHQTYIAPAGQYLAEAPTLREALQGVLTVFAERMLDVDLPQGCFVGDNATTGGFVTGPIADTLRSLQEPTVALLTQRVETAIGNGELVAATSVESVVQYVMGQFVALAGISRSNPSRAQLESVIGFMLAGLPWAVPAR